MNVKVEKDSCISCGACEGVAPEFFEMDNEGLYEFTNVDTSGKESEIQDAVDSCPTEAISVDE